MPKANLGPVNLLTGKYYYYFYYYAAYRLGFRGHCVRLMNTSHVGYHFNSTIAIDGGKVIYGLC
jgi:hypothetical protein